MSAAKTVSVRGRTVTDAPVRIGISSCLLGNLVRYDGGHKRDAFLVETLGRYVEWVPVCPEVEVGLGTPRPPLRLEQVGNDVRLVMPSTDADYTDIMRRYATRRVAALAADDLSGYVLKKNSPSCGLERVQLYRGHRAAARSGRGLFAAALLQRFPNLPVEEEGRLNDVHRRDHFIERMFAYRRLQSLFAQHWTRSDLTAFHTAHRLQLLVHSPRAYAALSRLIAPPTRAGRQLRQGYETLFMRALGVLATPQRHVRILEQIAYRLHAQLGDDSRRQLTALINDYRRGALSLSAPLTAVRRHVRRFHIADLERQTYLQPDRRELRLRTPSAMAD